MRLHYTTIAILLIVASLAISAAYAGSFTVVKPGDMHGWVLTTISSANPIPNYKGISTGFIDPAPRGLSTVVPVGSGAFYCTLGGYGSTTALPTDPLPDYAPGQVWLGTNAYDGLRLDQIGDIQYNAWTTGVGLWNKNDKYFAPPRQPMGLRLVVKEAAPSTVTHMFIWRPWNEGSPTGFGNAAYYPDDTERLDAWKIHNPTLYGVWLEFTYMGNPCNWTGTWTQVQNKYLGATITTPPVQIPGVNGGAWPEAQPVNTPNGCGVSLQWGAEAQAGNTNTATPPVTNGQPYMPYINWWRETIGGMAYVDCFEISTPTGYDTYDFEAATPGQRVASSTNGTQDTTGGKAPFYGHLNLEFTAFGKVISKDVTSPHLGWSLDPSPNGKEFVLDDGGIQIRVFCPGNTAAVGQYLAATGKLMPSYMMYLSGEPRHMRLHCTPNEVRAF